jgi:mannose-6-phosphate isomerase-like protein (cupin superfamily)
MMANAPQPGMVDAVQIFDSAEALAKAQLDMASSPNSHIKMIAVPAGGEQSITPQDSDEILVVLSGQCTVEKASGPAALREHEGFLAPPGSSCTVRNTGDGELALLSMRVQRPVERPNPPSDAAVKIPLEYLNGRGFGHHLYAYVMDRQTVGISPHIYEEWNQASAVRMNCKFEEVGDVVHAKLPERVARWYGLTSLEDSDYTLKVDRAHTRVRVDFRPLLARQLS